MRFKVLQNIPPIRRIQYEGRDLEQIQPLPDVPFEMLDPAVRYLWLVGKLIFWGLVVIAVLLSVSFSGRILWLVQHSLFSLFTFSLLAVLALLHLFWPFISYRHWGYAMRDTDMLIRFGVLWKTVIAIPFNRIQHVDSNAGPLTRGMGLARLVIHTAGSQMGSVGLPGLPAERAESLRDYLSQMGHAHANI